MADPACGRSIHAEVAPRPIIAGHQSARRRTHLSPESNLRPRSRSARSQSPEREPQGASLSCMPAGSSPSATRSSTNPSSAPCSLAASWPRRSSPDARPSFRRSKARPTSAGSANGSSTSATRSPTDSNLRTSRGHRVSCDSFTSGKAHRAQTGLQAPKRRSGACSVDAVPVVLRSRFGVRALRAHGVSRET